MRCRSCMDSFNFHSPLRCKQEPDVRIMRGVSSLLRIDVQGHVVEQGFHE